MGDAAEIRVRLRSRGNADELIGFRDGVLQARVAAAPVGGRANRALCRMIAKRLRIAPSRVTLARGERSRDKLLRVEGLDAAALREALGD